MTTMRFFVSALLFAALGCSSSSSPRPADTPPIDAGPDVDIGQPRDTFPAAQPSMPQIVGAGWPVLASARIVPIFYPSDPLEAKLVDFIAKLVAWPGWTAMVGEYGVGAASVATTVHLAAAAAATYTDSDIRAFVASQLDGTHAEWGAVDPTTLATSLYVLFFPSGTTIKTSDGAISCSVIGGYHDETRVGTTKVAFAVLPRCTPLSRAQLDDLTLKTTHEILEAVTDPLVQSQPAFRDVDQAHAHWSLFNKGGENGDMCQTFDTSAYTPPDLGYMIQRTWSNASAKAGHDPCLPVPSGSGAYFGAAPPDDETVNVVYEKRPYALRGIVVPVGTTRVVPLRLFSDAKTEPFAVEVFDVLLGLGYPRTLDLSLDAERGQNGQTLHLSITANAKTTLGASVVRIDSLLGGQRNAYYLAVGTP